jgi:hypothetical protein
LSFIYLLTLCGTCKTQQDTLPTNIIVSNPNELHLANAKSLPDNIVSLLDEVNDILDVEPNIVRLDVTEKDKQIAHLIGKKFLRPESFDKDEVKKLDLTEWATQVADNQQNTNANIDEYIKKARTNTEDTICVFVLSETLQTGQCNFNGEAVTVYNIKNEKAALLKEVKTLIEKNEKRDETQRRNIQLYLVYNPVCGNGNDSLPTPVPPPVPDDVTKQKYVEEAIQKFYEGLNQTLAGSDEYRKSLTEMFSSQAPNTIETLILDRNGNSHPKNYAPDDYINHLLAFAKKNNIAFSYEGEGVPDIVQNGEFRNGYRFTVIQKIKTNTYCDETRKEFQGVLTPEKTALGQRWIVKIDKIKAKQVKPCPN